MAAEQSASSHGVWAATRDESLHNQGTNSTLAPKLEYAGQPTFVALLAKNILFEIRFH